MVIGLPKSTCQKIEISRVVVIDESRAWDWKNQCNTPSPTVSVQLDYDQTNGEESVITETHNQKPQRARQLPARFADYELYTHNAVTTEGDMVNFALLPDAEPINFEHGVYTKVKP